MMHECFCDSHADHLLWSPAARRPLAATASPPSYVCRGEAEGGGQAGAGAAGGAAQRQTKLHHLSGQQSAIPVMNCLISFFNAFI